MRYWLLPSLFALLVLAPSPAQEKSPPAAVAGTPAGPRATVATVWEVVYIATGTTMILTASSITHNLANGGMGKNGGSDGQGVGGGIYSLGTLTVNPATASKNKASTSHDNI
jgi:hypothetical protein